MTFQSHLENYGRHAISAMKMVALVGTLLVPLTASAQNTKRIPLPPSQNPRNADLPIAGAVWAGDTLYVSGWLDPDLKTHQDTKSQTEGLIRDLQKLLGSQKLTLGDVVMMHVYLGADPAKGSKMDFEGMMAAYSEFFGTQEQPNKPARTTVQVVLPAGDRGALVEIDVIAVRPKFKAPHSTHANYAVPMRAHPRRSRVATLFVHFADPTIPPTTRSAAG